ncbi:MAG: AAA family ATPase [Alphaproteobacteria bacterium]|nr:AAA family ATPase [Bacteroidales bacterium]MBQ2884034.1 AAA family ATPase [Alphaproteobacteria bacterium]
MIDKIQIKNFKSIVDLTLELGKFNVIIGANGCGKTNILEAITFASAASQSKLDVESLVNRDIRIPDSRFMFNAFDDTEQDKSPFITINVVSKSRMNTNIVIGYAEKVKEWVNLADFTDKLRIQKVLESLESHTGKTIDILHDDNIDITNFDKKNPELFKALYDMLIDKPELSSFITYRPTEGNLRKNPETRMFPFGTKGEGLLKYLKELGQESSDLFAEINNGLHLLDWFDNFSIPDDLLSNEYALSIGDKYLKESMHMFDQRSTNEGFLYLLFYITLFNSKDTPNFFAIDNIEISFNPKLCTKLTEYLVESSVKNDKQVILTTHSPYVLDGLDLSNDYVRLFVARRNIDGHTQLERICYREGRNMLLSELWMSGLIGGLPDNF